MAYVKMYPVSGEHLENVDNYLKRESGPEDPKLTSGLDPGNAANEISQIAEFWGKNEGREAYHIIHSLDPSRSQKVAPEEFTKMGEQMVKDQFPGHHFYIVTHTEDDHLHNHILISSVNMDTGKKLRGDNRELWGLREKSNQLCAEKGIPFDWKAYPAKAPEQYPDKVRQIARRNGRSWILDLKNKADVARKLASNYDEYIAYLNGYNINVRIENKNITYFYSEKQSLKKRGSKLGKAYDTAGLESRFASNRELFKANPGLLQKVREYYEQTRSGKDDHRRVNGELLLAPGKDERTQRADRAEDKHTKRRQSRYTHPSDRELHRSVIPIDEINRAKHSNILDYCKLNKIDVIDKDGKKVLKGREFISIGEYEWINNKNNTHGNLIDFVALHRQVSQLKALSMITGNKHLLELEKLLGETKLGFKSFYIPNQNQAPSHSSAKKVADLFKSLGLKEKSASQLFGKGQLQVRSDGVIRLFGQDDHSGGMEFTEGEDRQWKAKQFGQKHVPFFRRNSRSKEGLLFTNPVETQKFLDSPLHASSKDRFAVLGLFSMDEGAVDIFVAQNPRLKKIHMHPSNGKELSKGELDFFNVLKPKLHSRGIELSHESPGHDRSRGHELSL